jgi:hypothetical protein
MYTTFHYFDRINFCDAGITDNFGTARCTQNVDSAPLGVAVPVDVAFIFNCAEYDTATDFTPGGAGIGTPTPPQSLVLANVPVENGICVLRKGPGPVFVRASFTSTSDNQPSLSTGFVQIGDFTVPATLLPTVSPPTPATPESPTPTNTAVPVPSPLATAVPTETPAPPPTATPTTAPTAVPAHRLRFSLDAARVAPVHDPGKGRGLDMVRPGEKVWLMMYYTVRDLKASVKRVTAYDIHRGAKAQFKASYTGKQTRKELGRFIRYTVYQVPKDMPPGLYVYQATLKLGGHTQHRMWRFAVLRKRLVVDARLVLERS